MKQLLLLLAILTADFAFAQQGQNIPVPIRVFEGDYRPSQIVEPSVITHYKAFDMRVSAQSEASRILQSQGYTCEYKTSIYRQCRKSTTINVLPTRIIQAILRRVGSSSMSFTPPHDVSGTLINNSPLWKVWRINNAVWLNGVSFRFYDIALSSHSGKLIFRDPQENFVSEAVLTNDPQLLKVYYAQSQELGPLEYNVYAAYVRYHRVK